MATAIFDKSDHLCKRGCLFKKGKFFLESLFSYATIHEMSAGQIKNKFGPMNMLHIHLNTFE